MAKTVVTLYDNEIKEIIANYLKNIHNMEVEGVTFETKPLQNGYGGHEVSAIVTIDGVKIHDE